MADKVWVSCERKDRNLVRLPVEEHLSPEAKEKLLKIEESCVFILDYFRLKVRRG